MHLKDTSITLLFSNYGRPPAARDALAYRARLLYILYRAQAEIVDEVVKNRGDALIPLPNKIWSHGPTHVKLNQLLQLPWSILSRTFTALMDFYDRFYEMTLLVTILDDKKGILGDITVGSYRAIELP